MKNVIEGLNIPRVKVDPVTLQVLGGSFKMIAQEMGMVLYRMSYSSIIRESEDIGAGIVDTVGRQLCESESTPMHGIIVGRCSNYVLENAKIPTIDVFVAENLEDRIKNIMKRKHLSHEKAKNHLIKKEKCRESYFNYYTSYEWGKPQYYDLCVNTSSMDLDDLVDHVESYINTNISNHIGKK